VPKSSDNPHAVRLGRQLRRLRLAAGYATQTAFGPRIGYGDDSISKVEKGRRVPTRELLTAWLGACEKSIDSERQVLTDGEREAITELWEAAQEAQSGVPEFIEKYLGAEKKAEYLLLWCPVVPSGLFQTSAYALELCLATGMDPDQAAENVDARMRRQEILDGPDAPHVTMLLHESVLHCRVGTPEIMIGELEHLLKMSHRRNVILQVIRDDGYFWGLEVQFEIASGDEIPHTLVTVAVEDQTVEEKAVVRKAITLFKDIQGRALTTEETRARITEEIEQWKSQQ
jgi:hypothetical protein